MSALERVTWTDLGATARASWIDGLRPEPPAADVAAIVADVRSRGDAALRAATARFDGANLVDPWIDPSEIEETRVEETLETALRQAAAAIRRYHADQRDALRVERRVRTAPGVTA